MYQTFIDRNQLIKALNGLRVVRLKRNTKQPVGTKWDKKTTSNPKIIGNWPDDANVGVISGQIVNGCKLIIIDVDTKNNQDGITSWKKLQAKFNLPLTASVCTPSGGWHYYYLVPLECNLSGVLRILQKEYPGIDLLGHNQIAAAPLSEINGVKYEWEYFPSEGIANLPREFVNYIQTIKDKAKVKASQIISLLDNNIKHAGRTFKSLLYEILNKYKITSPGQRDDKMHRAVACLAAKGLPKSITTNLMVAWHRLLSANISTEWSQCMRALESQITCVYRAIATGKFTISTEIDHLNLIINSKITQSQELWLSGVSCECFLINKGGHINKPRTLTTQEKALCKTLIMLSNYQNSQNKTIKITNKQIKIVMQNACGIDLGKDVGDKKLRRLLSRFISRDGHQATHKELLKQISVGKPGTPSTYQIVDLPSYDQPVKAVKPNLYIRNNRLRSLLLVAPVITRVIISVRVVCGKLARETNRLQKPYRSGNTKQ